MIFEVLRHTCCKVSHLVQCEGSPSTIQTMVSLILLAIIRTSSYLNKIRNTCRNDQVIMYLPVISREFLNVLTFELGVVV